MQEHPILSKLNAIDQMAIRAELAAEGSLVFARGFINGLKYAAETAEQIRDNAKDLDENTKMAFSAYIVVLANTAENYVAEIKKGEASSLYDET